MHTDPTADYSIPQPNNRADMSESNVYRTELLDPITAASLIAVADPENLSECRLLRTYDPDNGSKMSLAYLYRDTDGMTHERQESLTKPWPDFPGTGEIADTSFNGTQLSEVRKRWVGLADTFVIDPKGNASCECTMRWKSLDGTQEGSFHIPAERRSELMHTPKNRKDYPSLYLGTKRPMSA